MVLRAKPTGVYYLHPVEEKSEAVGEWAPCLLIQQILAFWTPELALELSTEEKSEAVGEGAPCLLVPELALELSTDSW